MSAAPSLFAQLLKEGRPFNVAQDIGPEGASLVGRIFRYPASPAAAADASGASPIDLDQRLNISVDLDDPQHPHYKPFCFFMGADGVAMLADNGRIHIVDSMVRLGITKNWMKDRLVSKGNKFAMVVLDGPSVDAALATWANLFALVSASYPELAPYVQQYAAQCTQGEPAAFAATPAFLARFGSATRVEEAHMMRDRTLALTPRRFLNETARTFEDFRVMLWQWFSANQHFAGLGQTADAATGALGVSEMFVRNVTLQELVTERGACIVELEVDPALL